MDTNQLIGQLREAAKQMIDEGHTYLVIEVLKSIESLIDYRDIKKK